MIDKGKGRRKGPLTDKSHVLTTRIREDTRHAVEKSAERGGRSISQEVELLLLSSLRRSDETGRYLQAVLAAVLEIEERLTSANGGAGMQDSAFVYFGVTTALDWAKHALPVPKGDPMFREVVSLDEEIAAMQQDRDQKKGRWLDARTDAERAAGAPATEIDQLDHDLADLQNRRRIALDTILQTRHSADESTRALIAEIAP